MVNKSYLRIYEASRFHPEGHFDYYKVGSRVLDFLGNKKIVVLCGATGTGKSGIALGMAEKLNRKVNIINADSMQVYTEVPIITAQPAKEHMESVSHSLYGMVSCEEKFSVGRWLGLVSNAINSTLKEQKLPIVVGGSGLYIKALINGLAEIPAISEETASIVNELYIKYPLQELYKKLQAVDPISARSIKQPDKQRILRALSVFIETKRPISEFMAETKGIFDYNDFFILYVNPERQKIYKNINNRFTNMLANGVINEVKTMLEKCKVYPKIIGLKQINDHIAGKLPLSDALDKACQLTRNYAKQQLTWFGHQMNANLILR